ncbi:MAG: Bug family tripartite tricarboxylate transporter substrate binding protein [Xanthobacteraceae bacterium]
MKRTSLIAGLCAAVTVAAVPAPARAQADFYKGKTVTVVIGARLTGSLSLAAQLVTRHMGKYIPGNPNVILRQMPGGAHLVATGYVFNVADTDGLTILAANPNVAMAQLAKMSAVRFDVNKYQWLGSTGTDGAMFSIRADLPYKTFKEFKDSGKELIAGTTGPGSNAHDMPLLLKEFAGAKLKIVAGYAANGDIMLAVERKEADSWSALGTTIKLGIDRGAVRALVRSRTPIPGFNHLPVDEELTTDPVGKALMAIRGIPQSIGRPFAVRPGVPADRVAILREALAKTAKDPQFLADAKTAKIEMAHITADQVTKNFRTMMNQPPQVLEAMGKYLKVGG